MSLDGIGVLNYPGGFNGFGSDTNGELAKALTAGYQVSSQTGGSALRVESLEASLKVTEHTAHQIKFWKKIPKTPAYSTVEEYNQVTSYGADEAGAFLLEAELPPTQDSTYARKTALMKFIGVTREVSHVMTVVHPAHGDVIAQSNNEGILWLLQRIERALFKGDSSLAFAPPGPQWDGLDALIDPTSFIDLAGDPLQEAVIEEASNVIVEANGYPSDMWLSTRNHSDLAKTLYPRERFNMPAPQNGQAGMAVNSVQTNAGVMELNSSKFITKLQTTPAAATSTQAPNTPTSISGAVNTGVTNGNFNKGAPAGTNRYFYRVTAANRFGESAPTAASSAVDITQAQKDALRRIDVTVTNAGTIGSFPPEYFKVYRTAALDTSATAPTDLSLYSLVLQFATSSQAASATTVAQDTNFLLPGTSIAYLGEMTPSVLTMRQLLPLMRMDLAVVAPSYRWMILMYGSPLLYTPKKWVRLVNIGQLV